ncbi:MAG: DUF4347 domain-containing protein, partial [Planctomycetota bacterium]
MANRSRAAKRLTRLYSLVVRRCRWLNHLASRGISRTATRDARRTGRKTLLSQRLGFFQRIGSVENLEARQMLSANLPHEPVVEQVAVDTVDNVDHRVALGTGAPVIFVDANVDGYESIVASILAENPSARRPQIHVLDASEDGIAQITKVLDGMSNVGAVHILSHGEPGSLQLGNTFLDSNSLTQSADQVKQWGQSLHVSGDIILYGCNVAEGEWGVDFLEDLSALTGADIAASNDLTGDDKHGGDWSLEFTHGAIDAALLSVSYSGTLATVPVIGSAGVNNFEITSNAIGDTTFTDNDTVEIFGKTNNDTFTFNDWPKATIQIAGGGGDNNTIDFKKVDELINVQTNNDGTISQIAVGDDSITPASGSNLGIQTIKGGKQDITLNMSAFNQSGLTFTIKDAKDADNQVVVTRSDTAALLLTIENVGSINGGTLDDTFIFENGAKMKGEIDGGGGNNSIDYSSLKRKIEVNLEEDEANTPRMVVNVDTIIGSPGASGFLASKDANVLVGDDGDQNLIGGPKQDVLQGGGGD